MSHLRTWIALRMERLQDLVRGLIFLLRREEAERLEAARRALRTPADHFRFAQQVFGRGPRQMEEEIFAFVDYAAATRPRVFCEIGTCDGGTTFLLGQGLGEVEVVIGIDVYVANRWQLGRFHRAGQRVALISGSSRSAHTLARVEKLLAGRPIDLLFIDGDHRRAGVLRDFQLYRRYVREGGLIAFHDIVPDHRARYGKNTSSCAGDVPGVWQEIRDLYPAREFIRDPEQDGCGIGVICYSPGVAVPPEW